MKIIGLAEFLTLPPGTVFTQYGYLCIKGETIKHDNAPASDFFYDGVSPGIAECEDALEMMGEHRWGECDQYARFTIFDTEDIKVLRGRLGDPNCEL